MYKCHDSVKVCHVHERVTVLALHSACSELGRATSYLLYLNAAALCL